jgi:hypothetical protein
MDTIIPEKYDELEAEVDDRNDRTVFDQYIYDLNKMRHLWCQQCVNWQILGGFSLCVDPDGSVTNVGGCNKYVER